MAISVTVSMRLPLHKRREDIAYAPCVAGVWPGRQSSLHCSGAHECSTPGRQAELQICSVGAERPDKSITITSRDAMEYQAFPEEKIGITLIVSATYHFVHFFHSK